MRLTLAAILLLGASLGAQAATERRSITLEREHREESFSGTENCIFGTTLTGFKNYPDVTAYVSIKGLFQKHEADSYRELPVVITQESNGSFTLRLHESRLGSQVGEECSQNSIKAMLLIRD